VRPEDMGRNGIGMRDVDHSGEQLWHSQTRAAAMRGQPQGAETGALQRGNLVKWIRVTWSAEVMHGCTDTSWRHALLWITPNLRTSDGAQ